MRAGSRAAGSHTAALAASDTAVEALFHQSGVIRADTIDEMFDIAICLDAQPLPKGRRVAIVTNAGGPGIMAVDACVAAGLTVAEFSAATCARLGGFLLHGERPQSRGYGGVGGPGGVPADDRSGRHRGRNRRGHRHLHAGGYVTVRRDLEGDSRGHSRRPRTRRRRQANSGVRHDRRPATRSTACR